MDEEPGTRAVRMLNEAKLGTMRAQGVNLSLLERRMTDRSRRTQSTRSKSRPQELCNWLRKLAETMRPCMLESDSLDLLEALRQVVEQALNELGFWVVQLKVELAQP